MMGVRAQQKERTRRSLVEAAFSQLSAERSFTSLSLREVAREAGIAPTSFYRHFRDVDELGLTMVDESGHPVVSRPTIGPFPSANPVFVRTELRSFKVIGVDQAMSAGTSN